MTRTPKRNPKTNKIMKAIIETKNGFVNAEFKKGSHTPEWFQIDQIAAQCFTLGHADELMQILDNNNIEVVRAIYVK